MSETEARVYPIQNDGYDFFTGVCSDGRQVVMGLLCPELVAFFFDPEGNLLGREQRPWSAEAGELAGHTPPYQIYGERFEQLINAQRLEWQAEIGYRPATIGIKEFLDHEYSVGIEVLPDYLQFLDIEAERDSEEERQDLLETRDSWLAEGNFVWWWAKDYYMSREGEIEST
jgi:hypothetical protein